MLLQGRTALQLELCIMYTHGRSDLLWLATEQYNCMQVECHVLEVWYVTIVTPS